MLLSRLASATTWSLLLAIGASSCSSIPPYTDPPGRVNEAYRDVIEKRRSQYRVKGGDEVTLRVFRELEPLDTQTFLILEDGRSDPFFLTNYRFAGKTIPEIEADLKDLLKDETSQQNTEPARLSIGVIPAGELVYMTGQFERPGPVALRIGMTVKEAMAAVLGMRITGDTDYALLRRPFRDPVHPEVFRIDLNDYTEDIVLLPGDEVYLGRTWLYAVVEYLREYLFGIIPGQLYSLPFGAM